MTLDMPRQLQPRFSIVIPHLNEHANLARCLDAIFHGNLDGPDFEVIVADNGSDPPPYAVCAAHPAVRLVIEHKPGPGPARNTGASLTSGELICFIDCDCFMIPGFLQSCERFFGTHPDIAFVGGSIGIWPRRPPHLSAVEAYEAVFSYRAEMFVQRDGFAATGNMVVRRTIFEAVGPFAGIGRHEDRDWGRKAVSMGHRIAYLPEATVLTPGCTDFAELTRRMGRHVAHDFSELPSGWRSRLRWLATAAMMFVSPLFGITDIRRNPQVDTPLLQLKVFLCLCRIRAQRGWLMLKALADGNANLALDTWNRTKVTTPVDGRK